MASTPQAAMELSLDDYIADSGFYLSPCGDAGFGPKKKPIQSTDHNASESKLLENRKEEDMDFLADIEAGCREPELNGGVDKTKMPLDQLIRNGMVKGIPKGTDPNIPLYLQVPENKLGPIKSWPKNMNHGKQQTPYSRPQPIENGRAHVQPQQQLVNGCVPPNQFPVTAPQPTVLRPSFINKLGLLPGAVQNFFCKNPIGGVTEYTQTINSNFWSKYDMSIQREIALIQNKPLSFVDNRTVPITSDGPGIETPLKPHGTKITLQSRFAQL